MKGIETYTLEQLHKNYISTNFGKTQLSDAIEDGLKWLSLNGYIILRIENQNGIELSVDEARNTSNTIDVYFSREDFIC